VGDSLAPWLYGVAYRTAHRARAIAARYRPANVERMEELVGSSPDDAFQVDLRPLLHQELNRLPGKYREPIVLCHLEGKTHEEAARLLRWPVGTVSGRLSRGRQLLRSRLERRGVVASSAMLSGNWLAGTPATVARPLLESTGNAAIRFAASQVVSTSILSLTQGVLKTMLLKKVKTIAVAFVLIGAATGGVGVWAHLPSGAVRPHARLSDPAPPQAGAKAPAPVRDAGSAPQPAQPPANTQLSEADDHRADCPPYCPMTIAANAFTRILGYFHDSSVPSR
jgi:hypothetical protein